MWGALRTAAAIASERANEIANQSLASATQLLVQLDNFGDELNNDDDPKYEDEETEVENEEIDNESNTKRNQTEKEKALDIIESNFNEDELNNEPSNDKDGSSVYHESNEYSRSKDEVVSDKALEITKMHDEKVSSTDMKIDPIQSNKSIEVELDELRKENKKLSSIKKKFITERKSLQDKIIEKDKQIVELKSSSRDLETLQTMNLAIQQKNEELMELCHQLRLNYDNLHRDHQGSLVQLQYLEKDIKLKDAKIENLLHDLQIASNQVNESKEMMDQLQNESKGLKSLIQQSANESNQQLLQLSQYNDQLRQSLHASQLQNEALSQQMNLTLIEKRQLETELNENKLLRLSNLKLELNQMQSQKKVLKEEVKSLFDDFDQQLTTVKHQTQSMIQKPTVTPIHQSPLIGSPPMGSSHPSIDTPINPPNSAGFETAVLDRFPPKQQSSNEEEIDAMAFKALQDANARLEAEIKDFNCKYNLANEECEVMRNLVTKLNDDQKLQLIQHQTELNQLQESSEKAKKDFEEANRSSRQQFEAEKESWLSQHGLIVDEMKGERSVLIDRIAALQQELIASDGKGSDRIRQLESEMSAMILSMNELKEEGLRWKDRAMELESQQATVADQWKGVEGEKLDWMRNMEEVRSELDATKQQLVEAGSRHDELRREYEELVRSNEKSRGETIDMKQRNERIELEKNEIAKELLKREDELKVKEDEMISWRSQCEEANQKFLYLNEMLLQSEGSLNRLKRENSELMKQLDRVTDDSVALNRSFDSIRQGLHEKEMEVDRLATQYREIEGRLQEKFIENSQLHEQLNETVRHLSETMSQLNEAKGRLDERTRQLSDTTIQLNDAKDQLSLTTHQFDETRRQLSEMTLKWNQLQIESAAMKQLVEGFQLKLKEAANQHEQVEEEVSKEEGKKKRYMEVFKKQNERISMLQRELVETKRKSEESLHGMMEQMDQLQLELNEWKTKSVSQPNASTGGPSPKDDIDDDLILITKPDGGKDSSKNNLPVQSDDVSSDDSHNSYLVVETPAMDKPSPSSSLLSQKEEVIEQLRLGMKELESEVNQWKGQSEELKRAMEGEGLEKMAMRQSMHQLQLEMNQRLQRMEEMSREIHRMEDENRRLESQLGMANDQIQSMEDALDIRNRSIRMSSNAEIGPGPDPSLITPNSKNLVVPSNQRQRNVMGLASPKDIEIGDEDSSTSFSDSSKDYLAYQIGKNGNSVNPLYLYRIWRFIRYFVMIFLIEFNRFISMRG